MSENINNTVETTKRIRRGISNETRAVNRLKFSDKDACNNGLFKGILESVTLNYAVGSENSNFAGLKLPYITFLFTSDHPKAEEKRYLEHKIFPIESNVETIPGGDKEWRVNNLFKWIKHILDIFYLNGRQLTEVEEDSLTLPFEDFDENGEYVMVEPQTVLDGYAALFTNVIAMLNGTYSNETEATGKPCYKNANGKPIIIWMKLLRHKKNNKGVWNDVQGGELAFDPFIGSGCIERYKGDGTFPSVLRLDITKESITYKETKKQPNLGGTGMPGILGGAVMANTVGMNTMPMDNNAFMAAGSEDGPF